MKRSDRRWLLAVLVVGGVYLALYLLHGWYAHDEGLLGQTAERVLQGEVPHRDFDDPYTGLLTYLHAAAFAIGGIRLPVLRIPLFLATLCWLAAVFRIARRSTSAPVAAAVALVALAWTVPNYPGSMPSWYNLFCATFGALALLRWRETGGSRWLVLAGIAGGVSFLFKLSGLFFVAGALLFLLYATRPEPVEPAPAGRRTPLFAVLISLGLLILVLMLWRGVAPYHGVRMIYNFVAPGAIIALALMVREWRPLTVPLRDRGVALLRAGVPFLIGAAIPVAIFAAGFATADALPAVIQGVFVVPFRRIAFARMLPPLPVWVLAAAPLVILLRPRSDWNQPKWRTSAIVVAVLLAALLWLSHVQNFPHRFIWQSLRGLIPLLAAIAAIMIAWPRLSRGWTPEARDRFLLLATTAAFASLIQFPFSTPVYFLYVFPLLLLAVVALVQGIGRTPPLVAAATLVFYGVFAVVSVTPTALMNMGSLVPAPEEMKTLDLPRGGLRLKVSVADLYAQLIPELQAHAPSGAVWAGPDSPEVYFLSGFRNRSRAIFDFLGDQTPAGLLRLVQNVDAIVVNKSPQFSPRLSPELLDSLRARFPEGHDVDHFEIRWRR